MKANAFNRLYYGWEESFIHKWTHELDILKHN